MAARGTCFPVVFGTVFGARKTPGKQQENNVFLSGKQRFPGRKTLRKTMFSDQENMFPCRKTCFPTFS